MSFGLLKPKYLLALAATAVLFGAVACSSDEEAADAEPAAKAAAPAAPPTPQARPTEIPTPVVEKGATAAAGAGNVKAPAAATAVKAIAQKGITELGTGRIEVPLKVAPLAALSAVAKGPQDFRLSLADFQNNIKPWREGGRNRPWVDWVHMAAFQFDPTGELTQGWATAYSLSEDGLIYSFHIHPDAKFTSGEDLTAEKVKWAYEFGMRPENQVGWGGSSRDLKIIEGADAAIAGETEDVTGLVAVDAKTLEHHLKVATPTYPYRMGVWLQGIFDVDGAEDDPDFFVNPVTAGAYSVSHDLNNKSATLTPNPHWWQGNLNIEELTITHVGDRPTQLIMYENGEFDMIYGSPGRQPAVHEPDHALNSHLVQIPYAGLTRYIRFNTARPPFEDKNLRKALVLASDHDATLLAAFGVGGKPPLGVLQDNIKCGFDASKLYGRYPHDPAGAQAALAASKYKTGENVPLLQIQTTPGSSPDLIYFEALQAAWKDVLGIDFKIHVIEKGQEIPKDINMVRQSNGAYVPDPGFLQNFIIHSQAAAAMHVNDEIDAKLDAANAMSLQDPTRCDAFLEVDHMFMDEYYILPFNAVNYMFLVQPWVAGFQTSVSNDINSLPHIVMTGRN